MMSFDQVLQGRDSTPRDPGAYPTPGQLWHELLSAPWHQREEKLRKLISAAEHASACFEQRHAARLTAQERVLATRTARHQRLAGS